MSKVPIIGVDVDDTLALHAQAFVEFSNKTYGTNFTLEDYSDDWSDIYDEPIEEIEKKAKEFHVPEILLAFGQHGGALEVLQELKRDYELVIVTARNDGVMRDPTFQWIDSHFKGVFTDIHFVPYWSSGGKATKAAVCEQIGAQYLIDDAAHHCNDAADAGIGALLFGDYGWNRSQKIHPDVTRVKDWQQVLEYFNEQG